MKCLFVVKKVLERTDGIKYLVIPKDSEIKKGDYVMITKINNQQGGKINV